MNNQNLLWIKTVQSFPRWSNLLLMKRMKLATQLALLFLDRYGNTICIKVWIAMFQVCFHHLKSKVKQCFWWTTLIKMQVMLPYFHASNLLTSEMIVIYIYKKMDFTQIFIKIWLPHKPCLLLASLTWVLTALFHSLLFGLLSKWFYVCGRGFRVSCLQYPSRLYLFLITYTLWKFKWVKQQAWHQNTPSYSCSVMTNYYTAALTFELQGSAFFLYL